MGCKKVSRDRNLNYKHFFKLSTGTAVHMESSAALLKPSFTTRDVKLCGVATRSFISDTFYVGSVQTLLRQNRIDSVALHFEYHIAKAIVAQD